MARQSAMRLGSTLAWPVTACQYDWTMLPVGQLRGRKELELYRTSPPLRAPATYTVNAIIAAGNGANAERA